MTLDELERLEREAGARWGAMTPADDLRALITAAREVIYCIEINEPHLARVQLRGYRKPVEVAGWTATKLGALVAAFYAFDDAGGLDAALDAAEARGREDALRERQTRHDGGEYDFERHSENLNGLYGSH
jgi:hypothetical protein